MLHSMGARTETRQEMLRAGARLLAAKGYEATALLDVVDAAKASRGSIYFHFPEGKQQLALEALSYSTRRALERSASAIQHGASTADVVRRTAKVLAAGLEESEFAMGCPVATVALEIANTNEPLRQLSADFFSEWRSLYVGSLLRDGVAPERAQRLATLIVATIEGGLVLARSMHSTKPLLDACEETAAVLELMAIG
jgi:TetR/AcrR family transcriptional repressor of lmrAB and yxaGH operons